MVAMTISAFLLKLFRPREYERRVNEARMRGWPPIPLPLPPHPPPPAPPNRMMFK